jgi:acetyl/propionyl-CoA carboxylase alpha subunit
VKYSVLWDGQTIDVEIDGGLVTVGGRTYSADLVEIPGTPLRQLLIDGRPLSLPVAPAGRGRWVLAPGGERLEMEVIDERTRHLRSLAGGGEPRRPPGTLKAPMPGLVVRIEVEPGRQVSAGDPLLVLEAMKMENELKAGVAGTVRAVRVASGEAVEKGQVLVEFYE